MIISTGPNSRILGGRLSRLFGAVLRLPIALGLVRNENGTVTIRRLGPAWVPVLTRNENGTVTISEL